MFNTAAYLNELRDSRDEAMVLVNTLNPLAGRNFTIREAYAFRVNADDFRAKAPAAARVRTAADLDAELSTAAAAAGLHGATDSQVRYIVALCADRGDFARMGYSRLTKAQASNLINDLKREG